MTRHLRVWQKLALLVVVFLIPFAVVTYDLVETVNTLGIDVARQELRGVEYGSALRGLLRELQVGGQDSKIEDDIRGVDEVDSRYGAALNVSADWKTFRGDVRELVRQAPQLSPPDLAARRSALTARANDFLAALADHSKLTVDPELDSFCLADVLFTHGPELSEALEQTRALGTTVLGRKSATGGEIRNLHHLAARVEEYADNVDSSLERAMGVNSSLRDPLAGPQAAVKAATAGIAGLIDSLTTGTVAIAPAELEGTVARAMSAVHDLEDRIAPALTGLLDRRLAVQQAELTRTLAWAAAGLLAILIIGLFIIRDIVSPLNSIVRTADRVAQGDLSVTIPSQGRRDEMGRLADSLSAMITRLSGLVGQVRKSGIQVSTSATEIAATAREQQATANEVAATTAEIGATSTEISATSKELVKTIGEVAAVAEDTASLAGSGQAGLARMETTMRQITEASSSINNKLAVLNEKAGNINTVVTTIAKVADQTNLLSLNAAIEAEKAGEYGRGFAVVATEIRRLADQTAVATYDIEKMVQEMHSAVSAGVMGMDKFSEEVRQGVDVVAQVSSQLTQIIERVQALTPSFEMVQEGMQSQSDGAQQISEALAQLSEAAQQTVESMHQSNVAIEQLNDAVRGLQSGVARFTLQE